MINFEYRTEENNMVFKINYLIYPLNVIMKTAYVFTDSFYIFFDRLNDDYIEVTFKSKVTCDKKTLEKKVGKFYNELLNQSLRIDIQNKTSNLRQLILGRALYTECIELHKNDTVSISAEPLEDDFARSSNNDYFEDTNNIALSWNDNMRYKGENR